jgi:uncharacterized cupredoxin-like copper-binding protein
MFMRKITIPCLLCTVFIPVAGVPSFANSSIKVSLWDMGQDMDLSKNSGLGLGMHRDMTAAKLGIKLDQKSVAAGKVTFTVVNNSKEMLHEMIVAPVGSANEKLPYINNENRVNEEAAGDLGEVSELEPGKSGALTLDLKPGLYAVYCNVPGHFGNGMWTLLKVDK